MENSLISDNWPGGWTIVKRSIVDVFTNIAPFLLLLVPVAVILVLVALFIVAPHSAPLSALIFLTGAVDLVVLIYMSLCATAATPVYSLKRVKGEKMASADFYKFRWNIFWRLFVISLLAGIITAIGFVLLVFPGIILVIIFLPTMALVPFVIVETKKGPIESFKAAHKMRKGHGGKAWAIIGWYFVIGLLIVIPVLVILIAILASKHITMDSFKNARQQSGPTHNGGNISGFGSNAFSSVAFAYLYRWIQKHPA